MIEHSAFVDEEREGSGDTYQKHLFVHIGERSEYSDPTLEVVFFLSKDFFSGRTYLHKLLRIPESFITNI